MNDFNLNRFGKTLRWYVSVNFRQLRMWMWCAFFYASVIGPVGIFLLNKFGDASEHDALLARGSAFIIALLFITGICHAMLKFNKKTARSSFLMLPASNLEKYLSMLVYVTVFLPVCAFVSIALGDTLRMVFCVWMCGDPWLSSVPEILSCLLPGRGLVGILLFIALVVWAQSLYVLGTMWLRRYSFVIATAVFISCYMLSAEIICNFFWDGGYYDASRRVYTVISFLLAAFNYWASFRIFKGFQLVTNSRKNSLKCKKSMKIFSLNRFGKMLRWYVGVNFRRLSMCTVSAFVGTFLVEMLYLLNYHAVDTSEIANISGFCAFAFAMVIVMGISGMMANLNKKSGRSSFLMLPVSNMEKYLSLLVYVSVILPVCIFVSIALGDTLRMVVRAWLYGDPWLSGVPRMLRYLFLLLRIGLVRLDSLWLAEAVFWVLLFVWIHSLYTLGGTWLRKYNFVVSSLVLIAVLYVCAPHGGYLYMFSHYWIGGECVVAHVNPLAYLYDIMYVVFAAFNYWASYHVFKRFQLITNKWTNYDVFKR